MPPAGRLGELDLLLHLLLPEQLLGYVLASPDLQMSAPQLFATALEHAVLPHCVLPRSIVLGTSLADARCSRAPAARSAGSQREWHARGCSRGTCAIPHTRTRMTSPFVEDAMLCCRRTAAAAHTELRLRDPAPREHRCGQLVCIDPNGGVCGVVASSDLLGCFLEPAGQPQQPMQQQVPVQ